MARFLRIPSATVTSGTGGADNYINTDYITDIRALTESAQIKVRVLFDVNNTAANPGDQLLMTMSSADTTGFSQNVIINKFIETQSNKLSPTTVVTLDTSEIGSRTTTLTFS